MCVHRCPSPWLRVLPAASGLFTSFGSFRLLWLLLVALGLSASLFGGFGSFQQLLVFSVPFGSNWQIQKVLHHQAPFKLQKSY
ncbi:hypothetical protein XELAEV_18011092mg [Xenopus laevis]|uniref:Uncharacterized protein n=1 Tax=Xenopus laevis TaxID=8355 RepID=A0A974DW10_XENLA|nr:hypothetical protein XELAEV_18011092mg [Xenopus laevis]